MALIKKTSGNNSHTLVTFKISKNQLPTESNVLLLGDFNNWEIDTTSSMKAENGAFIKSLKLENGQRYEFRYMDQNYFWFNDDEADDYVPSPYEGVHNCVVDLTKVKAPKKATKKSKKSTKDDLKKVEGIGPKIASILVENRIDTFEKLSKQPIDHLENLLKSAGPRFSMHKPTTWPKQAKLAQQGKWEELKNLQDQLKGGR